MINPPWNLGVGDEKSGGEIVVGGEKAGGKIGVGGEKPDRKIRRRRGTLRGNRTAYDRIAAKIGCVAW